MDNLTNVTTGEVRFSYAHLFKPYAAMPGQEERFSVTVLVPKSDADTMGRIHTAIEAAKQRGISDKWNGACRLYMTATASAQATECLLARNARGTGCLRPAQKRITLPR